MIGLPGDRIQITGGQVYVNGIPLTEPYIAQPAFNDFGPVDVPPLNLFVLGTIETFQTILVFSVPCRLVRWSDVPGCHIGRLICGEPYSKTYVVVEATTALHRRTLLTDGHLGASWRRPLIIFRP